jgi:hypothetical protein
MNWYVYCDNNPINMADETGCSGRFINLTLGLITSEAAFSIGLALAGLCAVTAASADGDAMYQGYAIAFGLGAAFCFAMGLGGDVVEGFYGLTVGIVALVTEICRAQRGARMGAGASSLAFAALGAATAYALMCVGALIADEAESWMN